ncbi:MAG TPA: D-aminoacyl-tRNA deacylase [Saprospiraceae bacterium]|nr:D-aminoacyl-tRNA deacylase [Saprospiraceae bacterium]
MRVVIQRVLSASLWIEGNNYSEIQKGLLVLLGIGINEQQEDLDYLVKKISQLRIFSDEKDQMNLSVMDIDGEILLVSQFTLFASTKKGNRPGFITAANPSEAKSWYEAFIKALELATQKNIKTGVFGADMKIQLINDGPVTIFIDSKQRE